MKERELTYSEETNISQHWVLNRMYQWSHMGVKLNIILGQLFSSEDARLQKCSSYQVSVFEYFLNSPFLVLFFFFILFIWVLSFGCTGPSLLRVSFLQLWRAWAALQHSSRGEQSNRLPRSPPNPQYMHVTRACRNSQQPAIQSLSHSCCSLPLREVQ